MAFYRIYRPQVIDEIDNAHVRDVLLSLLQKDRHELPHAYLFTGSRGTGKTTAARVLAKIYLCQKLTKEGPCGKCEPCRQVAGGTYLDVLEIDAASNRGIDEIRTLRDGIALAPVAGGYKIYIIDEVHMLTNEAFNALLKTLEEPPAHAVFILATTDPQKLPKTIISRCLHVSFTQASETELLHALKRITVREKIDIDESALKQIAKSAEGSFRDAVKYLEQVSFQRGKVTLHTVSELLAMTPERAVSDLLATLTNRDTKGSMKIIGDLLASGSDIKSFITQVLRALEQSLLQQVEGSYTGSLSAGDIKDLIRRFSIAFSEMKGATIPQLPLELAVVEFCDSAAETARTAIAAEKISAAGVNVTPAKAPPPRTVPAVKAEPIAEDATRQPPITGMLTIEHLTECWKDVIEECKPLNHSIAGVLRSARPKDVAHGIVTLEAFYKFHQEKISEVKSREMLMSVFKKLFGEDVKIEVVLGKK